jgi:hypothetical protein
MSTSHQAGKHQQHPDGGATYQKRATTRRSMIGNNGLQSWRNVFICILEILVDDKQERKYFLPVNSKEKKLTTKNKELLLTTSFQ